MKRKVASVVLLLIFTLTILGLSTQIGNLIGKTVKITLIDDTTIEGTVTAESEDSITLESGMTQILIKRENIKTVELIVEIEQPPEKPISIETPSVVTPNYTIGFALGEWMALGYAAYSEDVMFGAWLFIGNHSDYYTGTVYDALAGNTKYDVVLQTSFWLYGVIIGSPRLHLFVGTGNAQIASTLTVSPFGIPVSDSARTLATGYFIGVQYSHPFTQSAAVNIMVGRITIPEFTLQLFEDIGAPPIGLSEELYIYSAGFSILF
ncbi:MAG: hypothetical protein A2Z21_08010 [Candidatus Fraserbacteria bacterium RBG_16_55_9]|uniref:Uncharacterized protein n=1 Tax=Fraserbacteria sp. (strain RBG_16_55_9) TaxID=1817864 RepID=A0A1F5UNJ5_FRAXR|nr:MAG: hypothetical protein A2Z21_08010 [Candidatus Fraserbacteria bacterium RBG_16_55_9]